MFAGNLREFERLVVPEPVLDYTTSRLLTMEYIPGKKITEVSPLRLMEIDGPGQVALEITKIAADCWFRLPPEFTMMAKTLLNLDRSVYTLDPGFDPNAVIRQRATEILQRNVLKSLAPGNGIGVTQKLRSFSC